MGLRTLTAIRPSRCRWALPERPCSAGARLARAREAWLPLSAQHVLEDEPEVGRALRQAAHQVGIPMCAERRVHAHPVSLRNQSCLDIAPDAVKHLELEPIRSDF